MTSSNKKYKIFGYTKIQNNCGNSKIIQDQSLKNSAYKNWSPLGCFQVKIYWKIQTSGFKKLLNFYEAWRIIGKKLFMHVQRVLKLLWERIGEGETKNEGGKLGGISFYNEWKMPFMEWKSSQVHS